VQCAHRIVELVIVKESQLVVNLGTAWAVIECGFIEVYRSLEVALGRLSLRILHQLSVTGIAYPIAPN
jgi:hypothetical protein